jgi:hypothetical protein
LGEGGGVGDPPLTTTVTPLADWRGRVFILKALLRRNEGRRGGTSR